MCFPKESTVLLQNGLRRNMIDVQIGDMVLTADEKGKLSFSPVVLHLHRSNDDRGRFLRIRTTSNDSITLSPQHLIYTKRRDTNKGNLREDINDSSSANEPVKFSIKENIIKY